MTIKRKQGNQIQKVNDEERNRGMRCPAVSAPRRRKERRREEKDNVTSTEGRKRKSARIWWWRWFRWFVSHLCLPVRYCFPCLPEVTLFFFSTCSIHESRHLPLILLWTSLFVKPSFCVLVSICTAFISCVSLSLTRLSLPFPPLSLLCLLPWSGGGLSYLLSNTFLLFLRLGMASTAPPWCLSCQDLHCLLLVPVPIDSDSFFTLILFFLSGRMAQ